MKINKRMTSKLLALMAIVFFNVSAALAQPGIMDIVYKTSFHDSNKTKLLNSLSVKQHKMVSVALIHESGQKFERTINSTSQFTKATLNLPKGYYQVLFRDEETGITQKFTTLIQ